MTVTSPDRPALAFLGTGLMGRPMIERLLAAGHRVSVWNRSRDKLQVFVPRMVEGYQQPIGATSTMLKDLDTALDLARSVERPLPMAAQAQQLMRLLTARGLGEADPAELASLYRRPAAPPEDDGQNS